MVAQNLSNSEHILLYHFRIYVRFGPQTLENLVLCDQPSACSTRYRKTSNAFGAKRSASLRTTDSDLPYQVEMSE